MTRRGYQILLGVLVGGAVIVAREPAKLVEPFVENPAIVNMVLLVAVVWLFRRRQPR